MDDHRSSNVEGMNQFKANVFIQSVTDLVYDTHDTHLEGTDSTDCCSDVDVHTSS